MPEFESVMYTLWAFISYRGGANTENPDRNMKNAVHG
jgi:hypothetical protein